MARRRVAEKRKVLSDPKYLDKVVTKFVNGIMYSGKKPVAENIFYGAIDIISAKTNDDGMKIFKKALNNVKPVIEVRSRRVGGATYQVPMEVRPDRRQALAIRWMVGGARERSGKNMMEKLAAEFMDAADNKGTAIKKRDDVHKMAEANKAFAHFRF